MRLTALRSLTRGLHTSRAAYNAASSSTPKARGTECAPLDKSEPPVKGKAVEVTESAKRDIGSAAETKKEEPTPTAVSAKRAEKAPEIDLDILTQDTSLLEPDNQRRPKQTAQKSESGPSRERSTKPRDRSSRSSQSDRSDRPGSSGDRAARSDRAAQSQAQRSAQGDRKPRAGAAQRAASRAAPSASPGVDMQVDNRPRGKQVVESVEFDTSFKALFGGASLLGLGAARRAQGRGVVEKSDWAVRRGMKPDQARREEILRAAGAYMTETPTTAGPSTLPANAAASQRARSIANWTMAMNPSMSVAAQQQAGKVFDAFMK